MARGGYKPKLNLYQLSNYDRNMRNFNGRNRTLKKINRNSLNANKQAIYNQYMNLNRTRNNLVQKKNNYTKKYNQPFNVLRTTMERYYNTMNSKGKAELRKTVRNELSAMGVNTKNMNTMSLKNRLTRNLLKTRYLRKIQNTRRMLEESPEAKRNKEAFKQDADIKMKMIELQKAILSN